ncbi:MAG: hypothetical protein AAGF45_07120 [Pseudomonadota bacterium]
MIVKAIQISKVWRLLPGADKARIYQDWLSVLAVAILLPWTVPVWTFLHARRVAKASANEELARSLRDTPPGKLTVVTFGFGPIVRPLIRHILPDAEVLSCSLLRGDRLRKSGKYPAMVARIGQERVVNAIVITDDETSDHDLLQHCRYSILVKSRDDAVKPAFRDAYIPFRYLETVKRPGSQYLLRQVLLTDCVFLIIAFWPTFANPILGAISLIILHLSFFIVYEIGYVENDTVAREERNPTLSPEFFQYTGNFSRLGAWLWAIGGSCVGLLGLGVATGRLALTDPFTGLGHLLVDYGVPWLAVLIAAVVVFRIYNAVAPVERIAVYPVLQLVKLGGYGLLLATTQVGAIIIATLVLARSIPYLVYRAGGARPWSDEPIATIVVFVVLLGCVSAVPGADILSLQAALALVWLGVRARRQLRAKAARLLEGRQDAAEKATQTE